ncbi:MAG TPA: septum site-determining protein MinD [Thermoflexia bacterium]|nr:septum site-determining protein MinD [Thermoflexia bacterium]
MSGKIITISSGKGGVGKSTTTANLGIALALLGKSVICIDADIGLRNLDVMLGLENRIVYDIINVVTKQCSLRKALVRDKHCSNLALLPAAQICDKSAISEDEMERIAREAAEQADFVFIDSPAGIEHGFRYAVKPADLVLLVTNPEVPAVRDADRVIGLLEAAGRAPVQLIINRLNPELVRRDVMLDADSIVNLLAIKLVGIVPEDPAILIAGNRGQPVVLDKQSLAGKSFRNIGRRLTGEEIPFMSLQAPSWLQRIFRFQR